jgi:putative transcriptional regulator
MFVIGLRSLGLLVAFLLQTALLKAALPTIPDEAPARPSLAGQLLVADPSMSDQYFERTVILIVQHSPSGSVGIVINKPIGETSIASFFEALNQKGGDVAVRVFSGGPVQPEVGFVVHSSDYHRPETVAVNDRVSMTSSLDILRDIGCQERARINPRGLRLYRLGTGPARTRDQNARLGDCGGRSGASL